MKKATDFNALRFLVKSAVIAAAYAALTLALRPLGFGAIQLRLSEALCVLPFFLPEAVAGLFVGCFISNLLTPNILILDLTIGSLTTLAAAYASRKIKNKYLVPLPPVILNALFIPVVISAPAIGTAGFWALWLINAAQIFVSEALVLYCLGLPLLLLLDTIPALRSGKTKKP